jgi:glycine cleavage system H protein
MANIPKKLLYTSDHEWVLIEDGTATIGITDHAQDQLGDIVFLGDLPEEGDNISQGDTVGVVESVKATSDIYAPISGSVLEVNSDLVESPELMNSDAYGEGWILKVEISDTDEVKELLDAEAYEELLENER